MDNSSTEPTSTESTHPVTTDSVAASPPDSESPEPSADSVRKAARRRALWCSGAGLSHLGYPKCSAMALGIACLLVLTLWWFSLAPSDWAARAVSLMLPAAIVAFVLEMLATWLLPLGQNGPGVLSTKLRRACFVLYPMVLALLVTMVFRFGAVRVFGGGMQPTIAPGQRLLYQREVDEARLDRGRVILWKPTSRSSTADSGSLLVGRILAVPGDTISLRGKFYVVNGQLASRMGIPGKYVAALNVPHLPESLKVPPDHYFIVQDRPLEAFDSRILSWATKEGVVSNNLFQITLPGLLRRLE